MELGERWGYRARGVDPLVEVEVRRLGTQKPARVSVRFVAERFEGREEWVPPARLKVLWEEVPEFEAREARWERVDTHPGLSDSPEDYAIDEVFRTLIDEALGRVVYRRPGVTSLLDVSGLARYLQIDEAILRAAPESFEDEGALIVPWATTEVVVRRACELYPDAVLREVEKAEGKARQEAMHGSWFSLGRNARERFITPEDAATSDDEWPFGNRCRELLREWCGADAVERRDELKALREEVVRLDHLMTDAILALRAAGITAKADELERQFGVPVQQARNSLR